MLPMRWNPVGRLVGAQRDRVGVAVRVPVPPTRPMSSASPRCLHVGNVLLLRLREARDEMTRSVHAVAEENVSATLTVAVPAARVFAVLADPTTHSAIDGTGWVQEAVDQAPLTEVGQIFRIDMYHAKHPNGDYQMANKVHVLDPPRAIGWLPGQEKGDGHLEFGGWSWRYDLAPLGPSETEVTLTYD